jgi:hypothetical protein
MGIAHPGSSPIRLRWLTVPKPPPVLCCGWGASLEDDCGDSDKKESVSRKIAFVGVWAFWKAPRFSGKLEVIVGDEVFILKEGDTLIARETSPPVA